LNLNLSQIYPTKKRIKGDTLDAHTKIQIDVIKEVKLTSEAFLKTCSSKLRQVPLIFSARRGSCDIACILNRCRTSTRRFARDWALAYFSQRVA